MAKPSISDTSSILGFLRNQPIKFQPVATGWPTGWTATKLPTGLKINATTGLIEGYVADAGTYIVHVTATNAEGSDTAEFPIGISPERYVSDVDLLVSPEAFILDIVLPDATVRAVNINAPPVAPSNPSNPSDHPTTPQSGTDSLLALLKSGVVAELAKEQPSKKDGKPAPVFAVTSNDRRLVVLRFVDSSGRVQPIVPSALCFSSKRYEPEMKLFYQTKFEVLDPGLIELIIEPSGSFLDASLADEETDDGTAVLVLCEIEWVNPAGGRNLRTSTLNFYVRIERDLTGEK